MESVSPLTTTEAQREATVATFIYDALLRREWGLSEDVIAAINAFPHAAALAKARTYGCACTAVESRLLVNRSVTVARIPVVPCAHAAGKSCVFLARIVVFLAAILTTASMAACLYSGEGFSELIGTLTNVLGFNERRLLELLNSVGRGDAKHFVTEALVELDLVVSSLRVIKALPVEYAPFAVLVVFFFEGVVGGLLVVQCATAGGYMCGFLVGLVACNSVNLGLRLSGGLTCQVTRRRTVSLAFIPDNAMVVQ